MKEIPNWLKRIAERQSQDSQSKINLEKPAEGNINPQSESEQNEIRTTEIFISDQWERLSISEAMKEISLLFDNVQISKYTNKRPHSKVSMNADGDIYIQQSIEKWFEVGNGNADDHIGKMVQILSICLNSKRGLYLEFGLSSCTIADKPDSIDNSDVFKNILGEKLLEVYEKEKERVKKDREEWEKKQKLPYDPKYGDRS